jgi:hypothetical protein
MVIARISSGARPEGRMMSPIRPDPFALSLSKGRPYLATLEKKVRCFDRAQHERVSIVGTNF